MKPCFVLRRDPKGAIKHVYIGEDADMAIKKYKQASEPGEYFLFIRPHADRRKSVNETTETKGLKP